MPDPTRYSLPAGVSPAPIIRLGALDREAHQLLEAGSLQLAAERFTQLQHLAPPEAMEYRVGAATGLAIIHAKTGQHLNAAYAYRNLLSSQPKNTELLARYSRSLLLADIPDKALKVARRGLEEPTDRHRSHLLLTLAAALSRLERREEALPVLNECLRLRPDNPNALFERALTRTLLGDHEGGEQDLARAKSLVPESEVSLQQGLDRLIAETSEKRTPSGTLNPNKSSERTFDTPSVPSPDA